jgi:uncharacterized membrane protein YraQ (UPF0718 family)
MLKLEKLKINGNKIDSYCLRFAIFKEMNFLKELWNFVLMSAPFLILGLAIAGMVHSFLNSQNIKRFLGKGNWKSVFYAALLGVPLPLCSCSVIPTAVTLRKSGASNGATSAFLIATPESGIDSIAMTYGLMDPAMAIIRPVSAFFSAFLAGILNNFFNKFEEEKKEEIKSSGGCCSKNKDEVIEPSFMSKVTSGLKYAFTDLIEDISFWLTIGLVAGAMISFFVPGDFFLTLAGWQSRLLILVIGIPLYICASATTPIAAAMVLKGMSPGTALLLLLVGPATNISNIAVLQKYIGKRGIMLNLFSIVFVALVFSYITDFYYTNFSVVNFKIHMEGHKHAGPSIFENICAVFISILILKGLYTEKVRPLLQKKPTGSCCG